jgi:DNA polymerase elongation subunit (family B)
MKVLHSEILEDQAKGKQLSHAQLRVLETMKDREYYDAATIRDNWHDPIEREKIKRYCLHDGDDALNFFHIAMPAYFTLCQTIPRRLPELINRRTGGAINSMFTRAYLQVGHSLPKASEVGNFQGAISEGYAGIYRNVIKWDVASLYPSIMLLHRVSPTAKDPLGAFQKILQYLTEERLNNKKLAAETGEQSYKDLEQAQKIVINSFYGFLATKGLLFNSPDKAEFVTTAGRDILTMGLDWAKSKGYTLVNCDTDSFSFTMNREVTKDERDTLLAELNMLYDPQIKWEDDGYFKAVVVAKAKNYLLYDGKKVKVKGAALKATAKEPAIREMMKRMFDSFLGITEEVPEEIYLEYVKEACKVKDITRWASKKSITEAILKPKRTQEERILEAIGKTPVQLGDKIFVFFETNEKLCLTSNFNGCYDKDKLLGKLFNTVKIFKPFYPIEGFLNYTLKKNQQALGKLIGRVKVIKNDC